MDDRARIADQLRRAFEGDAWHGPAVLELLRDVGPVEASARPIRGAHTIWELVLHLASTYRLVLRRVRGDGSPLGPEEDWPVAPPPTEERWRDAVEALRSLNEEARRTVTEFAAERLDEPLVPSPAYTAWVQFVGLTQHDLYHAGQIALLKRAMSV